MARSGDPYNQPYRHEYDSPSYHISAGPAYKETTTTKTEITQRSGSELGAVTPEDIRILPNRAGDVEREKTTTRLQEAHGKGYLSDDELEARLAHAREALTKEQLTVLISDLPQPTQPSRAGDADRDRSADLLTSAWEKGHITIEERDSRIEAAMKAVTVDELRPLTADLPPPPAPKRPPKPQPETLRQRLAKPCAEVIALQIATIVLGVSLVACPWILASGKGTPPIAYVIAVFTTAFGVGVVVGGISWILKVFPD